MIRSYSDHAANERTLLAWVRTGTAVIAFGFVSEMLDSFVVTIASANSLDVGRRLLIAGIAVMIAVSAMASQYALLRVAVPGAISTAVMTGNLTNAVLSLMDGLSPSHPLMTVDSERLKRSLRLLISFLAGCIVAAAAISLLGDWAWSLPAALAAVAIALR